MEKTITFTAMHKHTIQQCSKCGQKLRFPNDIGGMLMACPQCGQQFRSDFKLSSSNKKPFFTACEHYFRIGFLPRLKQTMASLFSCWFKAK